MRSFYKYDINGQYRKDTLNIVIMEEHATLHLMTLGIIIMAAGAYIAFVVANNKFKDGADNTEAVLSLIGGLALMFVGLLICDFI